MDDGGPRISLLTPTLNRAAYLERVWAGLNSQTYRNFEWIVADDGSTDDTQAKLQELSERSFFPITIIRASQRVGKARMDNEAIARATGDFILWCDSDDYFVPHALERLVTTWKSIPEDQRDDFISVTALCADNLGIIRSALAKSAVFDATWHDLGERYKIDCDLVFFIRAAPLKNQRFPEVDLVVPENVVWTAFGAAMTRVLPEVLQIKEYKAPNCISFSRKMEYSRGRAHALAISERALARYERSFPTRLWKIITFLRYSIHGEIAFGNALSLWGANSPLPLTLAMWPAAALLALKDRAGGKVIKTHREFLAARETVAIECRRIEARQRSGKD